MPSKTARRIFNRFDCSVTYIHDRPNGTNINNGCGSTHLEDLAKRVVEGAYDVGIAFDGDADRCLVVDEKGRTVDGDQIMAICAARLKEQGKLQNNGFVATIMSNLGLHKFAKEHDMNLLCSGVGDRHVLELMREKGLILGGEQSGHIIFLNHMTTGDGQLAALQFLQILSASGMTVSQLAATVPQYPQHLENVKAPFEKADKQALLESDGVKAAIAEAEAMLGEEGRVLVRPSGTEALIRVMAEAGTQELAEKAVALVAASVENAQKGN